MIIALWILSLCVAYKIGYNDGEYHENHRGHT